MKPTDQPWSIFIIANNPSDFKRMPIANALHSSGHRVGATKEADPGAVLRAYETFKAQGGCDLVLTFSWSFLQAGGRPFDPKGFEALWSGLDTPTAVLWDDNPLRWIKMIESVGGIAPQVRHLVIDSEVVAALADLGVPASYFPIYFVEPGAMVREKPEAVPDVDILLCGAVADPERYFELMPRLIPDAGAEVVEAARAFIALKATEERYVDALSFTRDQGLELDRMAEAEFCRILTGFQRTADRVRILQRMPSNIRVGLVGSDLSAEGIPEHVRRYPAVPHGALGHYYRLPAVQFGTCGWPAACNLRFFQAAAFGGVMFHENTVDARRHFGPEAAPLLFDTVDELVEKMVSSVRDPGPFREAAAACHARFKAEHTVMHRARQLVHLISNSAG